MKNITAFKDCVHCKYFERVDKYNMRCQARNKKYLYGQTVPCEDQEKLEDDKNVEDNQ